MRTFMDLIRRKRFSLLMALVATGELICAGILLGAEHYGGFRGLFLAIDRHGSGVQAIAAVAGLLLGGVGIWQALMTREALKESREQRLQGHRPLVIPVHGPVPTEVVTVGFAQTVRSEDLTFMNVGHGPALDVYFAIADGRIGHLYGGKVGLLTPDDRIQSPYGPGFSTNERPGQVVFDARYRDILGGTHRTTARWDEVRKEWEHIEFDAVPSLGLVERYEQADAMVNKKTLPQSTAI